MTIPGRTLVARVAQQLADLSLESEAGTYIGAEDELIARLGVSRPTLRQAAKIAETERMISVRRGVRGGFYAERPVVADAMRVLNRYLRLQGAGLNDIRLLRSVQVEAAGLAAACTDEAHRTALVELAALAEECSDANLMMGLDTRFAEQVVAMSGNPVAELVVGLAYAFGRDEQGVYLYAEQEQRQVMGRCFDAITAAILAHDAELARFEMDRRIRTIHEWIDAAGPERFGPLGDI